MPSIPAKSTWRCAQVWFVISVGLGQGACSGDAVPMRLSPQGISPPPYDFRIGEVFHAPASHPLLNLDATTVTDSLIDIDTTASIPVFLDLADLAVSENRVVAWADRSTTSIHMYDPTDGSSKSFGRAGQGPYEFSEIVHLALSPSGEYLSVLDLRLGIRFYRVNSDSVDYIHSVPVTTEVSDFKNCGSEFVMATYDFRTDGPKHLLRFYSVTGDLTRSGVAPWVTVGNPMMSMVANRSRLACSPDGSKIAIVRVDGPTIRVFDTKNFDLLSTGLVENRLFRDIVDYSTPSFTAGSADKSAEVYDLSVRLDLFKPNILQYKIRRSFKRRTPRPEDAGATVLLIDLDTGGTVRAPDNILDLRHLYFLDPSGFGVSVANEDSGHQIYLHNFELSGASRSQKSGREGGGSAVGTQSGPLIEN